MDREPVGAGLLLQPGEEIGVTAADAEPVGDPDRLGLGLGAPEGFEPLEMGAAIRRMRLQAERAQAFECALWLGERDLGRGLGETDDRHGSAFAPGGHDAALGDGLAFQPVGRSTEAIVDQKQQRAAQSRGIAHWIPDRAGNGENRQGRHRHAQRQQPPGRMRRRFALRDQVTHDLQRREVDPLRPRRRDAQDQPEHRQQGQRDQGQRR